MDLNLMDLEAIIQHLRTMQNPEAVKGMARFGINPEKNLGISVITLRNYAKHLGKNHTLALQLWKTEIRDARILASLIDEPTKVTPQQMDQWVSDFNSWDICDTCCGELFDKTPYAYKKAQHWANQKEEFIKRAGFALMAWLAVHDKKSDDDQFLSFLPVIIQHSNDERNYVKKAVNWALRQIGKRNLTLHKHAVDTAHKIQKIDSKTARWIANDAIRELNSEKTLKRLTKKQKK